VQLVLLFSLLVGPYVILTGLSRWTIGFKTGAAIRARIGISLFFGFTALGHFIRAVEMSAMLPPAVPYRLAIVYLIGILELLGATTLWLPGLMRPASVSFWCWYVSYRPIFTQRSTASTSAGMAPVQPICWSEFPSSFS
jgi:DoxX-like family